MTRSQLCLCLTLFILFSFVTSCESTAPTRVEIWQKYRDLYTTYQQDLYEFGSEKWPDLEPVLRAQLSYDRARMRLRTARFRYLLRNDPDRIIVSRGIHEFVNFPWGEEDARRLGEAVPGAAELQKKVRRLKDEHFNHPDWPKARERFQSLPPGSGYHEISRTFQRRLDAMDAWLERYNQSRPEGGPRTGG